jgi:hypothetical protein
MKTIKLLFGLLLAFVLFSSQQRTDQAVVQLENYFVIEGMQVEWEYTGHLLTFKLHAPYQGWLALGFNEANAMVNTNLIMGAVAQENAQLEEFFVTSVGNPQPIHELGSKTVIDNYLGLEDSDGTSFQFTIDTQQQDDFHYDLSEGRKIWLICAYSMEDDFGHHSIMRRHVEVEL